MKDTVIAFTLALSFLVASTSFGLEHSPYWAVGDTVCRYGLPGEGTGNQYVEEIPPGSWALSRFGNFLMRDNDSHLRQQFNFNAFTEAGPGGFTTENMDSPHGAGLFAWSTGSDSFDRRFTFAELGAGSWSAPTSGDDGSVQLNTNGTHTIQLFRYFKMTDAQLPSINSTTKRYVILIHGWNPGGNVDAYDEVENPQFGDLYSSISDWLWDHGGETTWGVLKYHMEADMDTGEIFLDPTFELGARNGTQAAEIARLHGYHLAKLILEKCPNVEYVHLIAHSAGAWAARSCLQYLLDAHARVKCQMTLLDAYVPAENNAIQPNSNLSVSRMNAITSFNNFNSNRIHGLDNYYFKDLLVPGTQEDFNWGSLELVPDVDMTEWFFWWGGHAGPVQYYADSVFLAPGWTNTFAGGWQYSLAYTDLEGEGLPDNTGLPNAFVQTSPSDQGLDFTVDARTFSTSQSFLWEDGITHTLSVVTPQQGSDGRQYVFEKWNDNDLNSTRQVTANGNATYTAIFSSTDAIVKSLESVADSHVKSEYPSQKDGDNNIIAVSYANTDGHQYQSLVRFNLGSIPPGSSVSYAEIRLATFAGNGGPDVGISRVLGPWTESIVCWTNKPPQTSSIGAVNKSGNSIWTFTSTELPSLKTLVQAWANNPSTNYGAYFIFTDFGPDGQETVWFQSKEGGSPPDLIVHYTPPPDTSGDPIVNLKALKTSSSSSSAISQSNWQKDNDPYFYWETTNTISAVVGYSFALDSNPNDTVDATVPYYSYPTDSIPDGQHVFRVKSLDAEGRWGPVASFNIWVDANPPTSGTIAINNGTASTWSPIVILNNLGANASPSGLDEMKFSNDGATWSSYESYAATKTGWDLLSTGGNTNTGTKTVYVRYKDNAGNESSVFTDTIAYDPSPKITVQPLSKLGCIAGSNITLSISTEGLPPLAYLWFKNGVPLINDGRISGATTPSLTISGAEINDTASYTITVSNIYGGVISSNAAVRVRPALNPTLAASIVSTGYASGLAVSGNFAYLVYQYDFNDEGQVGLNAIDASDPVHPILVGGIDTGSIASGVAVMGSYAYVATDWSAGLQVIDVSDPSKLTQVGNEPTEAMGSGITISGHYAYVADQELGGVHAFDIANPTQPMHLYRYETPGLTSGVAASGDYVYLTAYWRGLQVIDVSDSTAPVQVGGYDTSGYAQGVAVSAGYAYVADGNAGLQVFDISNPTNPVPIGVYNTDGYAFGVAVSGNYAFVADGVAGLQVIDVSDPALPVRVGGYDTSGEAHAVELSGNYAYVADGEDGLVIIQFSSEGQHPPNILEQPHSRTGLVGDDMGFSVKAWGSFPLRYQWYYDGNLLNGSTNAWLSFTNIQLLQRGQYHVVVTNAYGAVTSAVATVTVRLRPIIQTGDSSLRFESDQFVFNISAGTNDTLVVETSTNLVQWMPLQTNLVPNSGVIEFRDADAMNFPRRFYRARLY